MRFGALANLLAISLYLLLPSCTTSSSSSSLNSAVSCTTANCITPSATSLSLTPSLDSTGQKIVNGAVSFNLAGDCNEGGFPFNQIQWTLHNGSTTTWVSTEAQTSIDHCINGRFEVEVTFPSGTLVVQPNSSVSLKIFGQTAANQPFTGSQASAYVVVGSTIN